MALALWRNDPRSHPLDNGRRSPRKLLALAGNNRRERPETGHERHARDRINGEADLNGDGLVNGRDESNAFYGDTSIIDGMLDCDAWMAPNDGAAGDLAITVDDDCTLIGYDGTADGVTIAVVDGEFQWPNRRLPTVFYAADPDNPDIGASDFAWSAINGWWTRTETRRSPATTATSAS